MNGGFVAASAVAIGGALGVIAARTPVHGVLALLVNFAGLAVLFLSLQAEFLAVSQIIIYAGAVLVLFLFVISLLTARRDPVEPPGERLAFQLPMAAASAGAMGLLVVSAGGGAAPETARPLPDGFGGVGAFGQALLQGHALELEMLGLILLVAMVGVMVIVGRRPVAERTPAPPGAPGASETAVARPEARGEALHVGASRGGGR